MAEDYNSGSVGSLKKVKRKSPRIRGSSSTGNVEKRPQQPQQPVKEALSPSVAESIRAVFAAFVWHEGIVHDTMAVASYLKFHPNLSKHGNATASGGLGGHSELQSGLAVASPIAKPEESQRQRQRSVSNFIPGLYTLKLGGGFFFFFFKSTFVNVNVSNTLDF